MLALIDTAVWIDWLRGRSTSATQTLQHLLEEGDARDFEHLKSCASQLRFFHITI